MSGELSGSMSDSMLSYANLVLRGSTKRRNENVPSRLIKGTPHLQEDRRCGLPWVAGWAGVSWYLEVFRWKSVVNPQKFSRRLGSNIHSLTNWERAHSGRSPGFRHSYLVSCDHRYCALPPRTSIFHLDTWCHGSTSGESSDRVPELFPAVSTGQTGQRDGTLLSYRNATCLSSVCQVVNWRSSDQCDL